MKRQLSHWAFIVTALCAALFVHATAAAAVPSTITQQGRLFNSSGTPVAGTLNITFAIYAVADQGASLWSEDLTVPVEDGYYSVRLGEATPFPGTVFNGQALWLGVKVGTDAEMTPRQPIVSVPYAFLAAEADHAATADSATTAASATTATTATNATGAITPRSVSVNGSVVIDTNGNWVGAIPDRAFSSLITARTGTVSANSGNGTSISSTVSCSLGEIATGGGCAVESITSTSGANSWDSAVKSTVPIIGANSKPTGWSCTCQGDYNGGVYINACRVTPYVICATD